jgi:hypothetical protein
MSIKEITKQIGGCAVRTDFEGDSPRLHRAWEISMAGRNAILKRYGSMCDWNIITLVNKGTIVYRIEKTPRFKRGKDVGIRTEFFNGSPFRTYKGDCFCFVEYIGLAGQTERIPDKEDITTKLDEINLTEYEQHLKQIFFN